MPLDWLSPAQCIGYIAFVLGVASFLQTDDRRFRCFMAGECLAYVAHFALLGNPTAVASSIVSAARSLLSLRTRSGWVAASVVAASVTFGLAMARHASDWLPLGASSLGTLALFLLQGIPMRLLMLCGTVLAPDRKSIMYLNLWNVPPASRPKLDSAETSKAIQPSSKARHRLNTAQLTAPRAPVPEHDVQSTAVATASRPALISEAPL